MQGRLGVDSTPGLGSTFWCELPLVEASPVSSPLPVEPARDFDGISLLLVEDNAVNRKVAVGLLSRLGCEVVCAENGREALAMVRRQQVHLIFMDIQLPDIDGVTVTQRLREMGGWCSEVPIVAMTAGGAEDDRRRCLAAGMNDYITKPLSLLALGNVLALQLSTTPTPMTPIPSALRQEEGDAALLNETTLATLVGSLGADSVDQLAVLYHQQASDYIAQLSGYFAAGSTSSRDHWRQVERLAHQLRGESVSMGAEQLAAQAKRLESMAALDEASLEALTACFDTLRHCAARTYAALERWRRDHPLH